MRKIVLLAAVLFGTTAASAQPLLQPAAFDQPPAAVPQPQVLLRRVQVSDLGFRSGFSFAQLSGQARIFFPMPEPAAVRSAELVLEITHGETAPADRYLQVEVAGRIVATRDLHQVRSPSQLTFPVDPGSARNGFLDIMLNYSGGLPNRVCVDQRSSGDFVEIGPSSHLRLTLDRAALTTPGIVAGFQPPDTRIALTQDDFVPEQVAAALRAAALFGADLGRVSFGTGQDPTGVTWSRGVIEFDGTRSSAPFAATVAPGPQTGHPAIRLGGLDPQHGLEVITTPWARLTGASPLDTDGVGAQPMPADRLGFAQLGFDLSPRSGSSVVSFDFPFDIARLPRGTRPGSVSILMQAADDPDGRGITTVAFLNDTMLGSNRISGGKAAWFDYDIPPGAIGRDNVLRVQILRQQRGGECTFSGQSFPAQVLAASRFNLVAAGEEAPSFHLLRQDMQQVVDLAIDPAFEDDVARLLNWSGPALASLIPPGATIRPVRELDPLAEATPFISVSITPPPGTEPRLRTDEGAVELTSADGTVLFNGSDLDRLGMVQIVTLGNRRGLWLRPGAGPPPAPTPDRPLTLDMGDVAFLDADGIALATSTTRPDILQIRYPDRRTLADTLNRYRPWIAGGLWLLITMLFLRILHRLYRTRRSAGSDAE